MLRGYYLVLRDTLLAEAEKSSYRVRLHKGDWLVTDGVVLGRFDKGEELDWVPVDWVRGAPVILTEAIEAELAPRLLDTTAQKLEGGFHKLVFSEPGEPMPDMPRPPFGQLASYLRGRRSLVATYTYDHRS
jgi:hypothetical protein